MEPTSENNSARLTANLPCLPPCAKAQQHADLLTDVLKQVSRSFYLTLRVLPAEIRSQISLAYLLARASDTIADTQIVPQSRRLELLQAMRAGQLPVLTELAAQQALPAERVLLERLPECYRMLAGFGDGDQKLIRQLHATIIDGQIFDLERFPGRPLTDDELDRYTYLVAGCVGEFWTRICRAHLQIELSEAEGVRFGKGLQLVNILRDIGEDCRRGRQYLPSLDDYQCWLDRATEHLDAGWQYTLTIPVSQKRLRLACVWPLWIGLKTIAQLRQANPLDTTQRVKVPRLEVYGILAQSILRAGNAAALDKIYRQLRTPASR